MQIIHSYGVGRFPTEGNIHARTYVAYAVHLLYLETLWSHFMRIVFSSTQVRWEMRAAAITKTQ